MMKHEFEALAGYEVSFDDYNKIIEPMYIAVDVDKTEFVKMIDRSRFELKREKTAEMIQLENKLNDEMIGLKNDLEYYTSRVNQLNEYLSTESDEYWTSELKRLIKASKDQIKVIKNRMKEIKWVLA